MEDDSDTDSSAMSVSELDLPLYTKLLTPEAGFNLFKVSDVAEPEPVPGQRVTQSFMLPYLTML